MTYVDESGPSVIVFCIKIIFDLTFFIIVTILGFNIVTAFSEERSEWVGLLSNAILICHILYRTVFGNMRKSTALFVELKMTNLNKPKYITADILYLKIFYILSRVLMIM